MRWKIHIIDILKISEYSIYKLKIQKVHNKYNKRIIFLDCVITWRGNAKCINSIKRKFGFYLGKCIKLIKEMNEQGRQFF